MIFFITKGKLSYYTKHLWRFIALCLHIINKPDKFNMFIYLKKNKTWCHMTVQVLQDQWTYLAA